MVISEERDTSPVAEGLAMEMSLYRQFLRLQFTLFKQNQAILRNHFPSFLAFLVGTVVI